MSHIRQLFSTSFKTLFSEEEATFLEDFDNLLSQCITEEENSILKTIPSPKEIKDTLFQMQDLKAPSPNSFPALFYKDFWPTVGDAVTQVITSFFVDGRLPKEANSSLIVLISKTSSSSSVNNYRFISLCNVVYKIISKLLASKLRPLLHKIISPCQFAFILGRWITEKSSICA